MKQSSATRQLSFNTLSEKFSRKTSSWRHLNLAPPVAIKMIEPDELAKTKNQLHQTIQQGHTIQNLAVSSIASIVKTAKTRLTDNEAVTMRIAKLEDSVIKIIKEILKLQDVANNQVKKEIIRLVNTLVKFIENSCLQDYEHDAEKVNETLNKATRN
ncbi:hypothetical protein MMC16_006931 [Acarospora aff. strigata]|nr:hypothetical protein [Acarospora aff. strigata]